MVLWPETFNFGSEKPSIRDYLRLFPCRASDFDSIAFSAVKFANRSSLQQILPVPGSDVKYLLYVLRVFAKCGLYVLRGTASTRSISKLCTVSNAILVFRRSILWNAAILDGFQGSVLRVLPSTGSIPSVGTASTQSTHKILLICMYTREYEVRFDHRCAVSIIVSSFYCRKH